MLAIFIILTILIIILVAIIIVIIINYLDFPIVVVFLIITVVWFGVMSGSKRLSAIGAIGPDHLVHICVDPLKDA